MTRITTDIHLYLRDLAQAISEPDSEIGLGPTDASVVAAALKHRANAAVIEPEIVNAAREYCARNYAPIASAR